MVGLINRSFLHLSPEMFRTLYTAYVRSHLEYVQAVSSSNLCKHINLIESVQRRATMVSFLRQLSDEDCLRKLNIPTMKFRRATGDLLEVYKHLNFYDKSAIANIFVFRTRSSRRHSQELQRHFAEDGFKGVQSNSFYFRSIKPWNNLPRNEVDSPSIMSLKND